MENPVHKQSTNATETRLTASNQWPDRRAPALPALDTLAMHLQVGPSPPTAMIR